MAEAPAYCPRCENSYPMVPYDVGGEYPGLYDAKAKHYICQGCECIVRGEALGDSGSDDG